MLKKSYLVETMLQIIMFSLLGLLILLVIDPLFTPFKGWRLDPYKSGQFANFVGGFIGTIFLFVTVVLMVMTFNNQRRLFRIERFENRFYEMLKIARENAKEVESKGQHGRSVFVSIKDDIDGLLRYISEFKYDIDNKDKANIAYLTIFYGVNNSSTAYLKKLLGNILNDSNQVNDLISPLEQQHMKMKEENENRGRKKRAYLKCDGHQSRLGHYFRHLYQTVQYVNHQDYLIYEDKYDYVRSLRAQLSNHEQAIFFYNSLSTLGRKWELGVDSGDLNSRLITKYNLVKNMPEGFTYEIRPEEYYPMVTYEGQEKTKERRALEQLYD